MPGHRPAVAEPGVWNPLEDFFPPPVFWTNPPMNLSSATIYQQVIIYDIIINENEIIIHCLEAI
jgi:hypothetical protein